MQLEDWIAGRGGIVHRQVVREARWTDRAVRAAVRAGAVEPIRRTWLAVGNASADAVAAARAGGRVACVTLAQERGWWMPDSVDAARHISILPHARPGEIAEGDVVHWTKPVAPASPHSISESIEDALAHIAGCLPPEPARVVWESAISTERLSLDALRHVRWRTKAAARLAEESSDLSDSGLESMFLIRLSSWGVPIRQQAPLAGRRVDFLIGRSLVVQVDGHVFHSTAADRGRDVRHDAELRLRGYTVMRFTYAQIVHDWGGVERMVARAIAAGLHMANVRAVR
ncbi:endonuclease domain-containing protein [Microbacterium rhizomatis]|uniref:DUF559 domain-containing protein n=1 Tax=Microbacterium rhizomatis TaxID=1631477 RepID=A0A5J5J011_9MICO|nr:DUF559 domain-containing protein [Microbacterium rhizomatis]KAA9105654.1 DUF559 domain-containing protein [Microbacterium rhizomatis]